LHPRQLSLGSQAGVETRLWTSRGNLAISAIRARRGKRVQKGEQAIKHLLLTRFRMRQLVAYIAVYEHRNIQAAARELALDHSTVSKSISDTEAVLDMALFVRHTRGVTPTAAADVLYRHSRQIVNQCARTAAELSRISTGAATHIVIGSASYLDTIAVKAVAHFKAQREAGQIIRLVFGHTKDLHRRLELGEIDLVISRLGVSEEHGDIHGLKAYDVGDILVAMFYQEGLALPNNVFEIASIFAARDILLENGDVVCALPSKSLRKEIEDGVLVELDIPIPLTPPPVGVLHNRSPTMDAYAEELVRALRETSG
jgi:DNA-binding transcriptional LysR family regulator